MSTNHRNYYLALFFLLLILVSGSFIFHFLLKNQKQITDFLSCAKEYPVMESYPRQCRTPDGKVFVEKIAPSMTNAPSTAMPTTIVQDEDKNIYVTNPTLNQVVASQFIIEGRARVFENILHYRLLDASGNILASGNLEARSPDVGQFGDFNARITHKPTKETDGILTVFSYSPKDGSEINNVHVPVRFAR